MIKAFLHVGCEPGSIANMAPLLADLNGVAELYTTTGSIDFIAVVRVADVGALANLITEGVAAVPGIRYTETHVAIPALTDRVDRVERTVLTRFWFDELVEAVLDDGVDQALLAAKVVVQGRGFDTGAFTDGARRSGWLSRLVHELGCRQ